MNNKNTAIRIKEFLGLRKDIAYLLALTAVILTGEKSKLQNGGAVVLKTNEELRRDIKVISKLDSSIAFQFSPKLVRNFV